MHDMLTQGGREWMLPTLGEGEWERMSMNRTDSTELRMLIRRHVASAMLDLVTDEALVLRNGERTGRPAIQHLDTLLEDLDDYEARLPKIVSSTRPSAPTHVD